MFWKKIVYTDRLADYRKIQCWEFHFFDEVIIQKTHDKYNEKGVIWVIIWATELNNKMHYKAITKTWKVIEWITHCKKYYWEFQEEFEALVETEQLALEVQERLQRLEQLKKKTDKIKDLNLKNLWL